VAGVDQLRAELIGDRTASHATQRRRWRLLLGPFVALSLLGCGDDARAASPTGERQRALDEALASFRAGLPVVAELRGGENSREALVRRFIRAVQRTDTSDVRLMLMTRAEFAYLYYPTSPFATRQPAGLWWFLGMENSRTGITRVFARLGGRPLHYVAHRCPPATVDGPSRTHDRCEVTVDVSGDTLTARLFGSIIERDGSYKFMGYGSDF
jgi:hypothetical protein